MQIAYKDVQEALLNALPPHSIESERVVLGCLLGDSEAIYLVFDKLIPEHFYDSTNRKIYSACIELAKLDVPIDNISVYTFLEDAGMIEGVSGSYITGLMIDYLTTETLPYHCERLLSLYTRRKLLESVYKIALKAQNDIEDNSLSFAKTELTKLDELCKEEEVKSHQQYCQEGFELLVKQKHNKGVSGVSTGFKSLDELLGGLLNGSLNILAARPGVGKTSLALNIANSVVDNTNSPVLLYSLEMEEEKLAANLIKLRANSGLKEDLWQIATSELAQMPLQIRKFSFLTIDKLKKAIKKYQLTYETPKLVVVDYLQLMEGTGQNRTNEIASISRGLKMLAMEFNCPFLVLSQLSRAVESREDKTPFLSDLRDSGSIEADADTVTFLHRPGIYQNDTPKEHCQVIVAKSRYSAIGNTELHFRLNVQKFIEVNPA